MAPKRKHAAFYRELGELVFWFAAGENAIYIIAGQLLGGPKIADPVLKTFHLDRAIELVRGLACALYPKSADLTALEKGLDDFKKCAQQRNELLHGVALPQKRKLDGKEVVGITSVRKGHVERELTHVRDLQEKVREVAGRFMDAAMALGIFEKRSKAAKAAG